LGTAGNRATFLTIQRIAKFEMADRPLGVCDEKVGDFVSNNLE
jgi:hypothetical protein